MESNKINNRCTITRKQFQTNLFLCLILLIPLLTPTSARALVLSPDGTPLLAISNTSPIVELGNRPDAKLFSNVNQLLSTGKYKIVIQQARSVITQNSESALAYEILGTAYFLSGKADEAIAPLEEAVRLAPKQSGPLTKLGIINMEKNKLDDAEALLLQAIKINAHDRFAHQRLGMLYEYNKDYIKSIKHFREGLKNTPAGYLGVAVNLGQVLNKLNQYSQTIEVLAPRLPIESPVAEAHLILATAYLSEKHYQPAINRFQRVLELQPDLREARLGKAIALRESGSSAAAVSILEKLTKQYPDWQAAYFELGETWLSSKQLKSAKAAFKRAVTLGSNPLAVQKRLAIYHIEQKEYNTANSILSKVIADDRADAASFVILAELLQAQGNYDKAESILGKGINKFPDNAYLRLRLGTHYAAIRRYQDALPPLKKAMELAPNDPNVLKFYSMSLARAGQAKAAADIARQAFKLLPQNTEVAIFYATQLEADKQTAEAESIYRQALKLNPNSAIAMNNLANLLAARGALEEASSLARRANQTVRNNGNLMDTLGWILYQQGRYEEAAPILHKATSLAPNSAVIHYHAGKAWLKINDTAKAKNAFNKALSINSKDHWAADAREQLHSLK